MNIYEKRLYLKFFVNLFKTKKEFSVMELRALAPISRNKFKKYFELLLPVIEKELKNDKLILWCKRERGNKKIYFVE